jgi:hypothetical protein
MEFSTESQNVTPEKLEGQNSEESSDESPPVFRRVPVYDYTRVTTSPVDISIPAIEEMVETDEVGELDTSREVADAGEMDEGEASDQCCDNSLVDAHDNLSVGAAVDDILAALNSDQEDGKEGVKFVTDELKYYKIVHNGSVYFLKADRAPAKLISIETESVEMVIIHQQRIILFMLIYFKLLG